MGQPQTTKNFDKTSGERLGHDDLVPSRYAVRVGEIDVLVISDGVLEPPAESMATNADPATRNAWLDRSFLAHDTFDWALNAVVVRSGKQTILIDSGIGGEVPDFTRAGLRHRHVFNRQGRVWCPHHGSFHGFPPVSSCRALLEVP